jgi:hypothetical protein
MSEGIVASAAEATDRTGVKLCIMLGDRRNSGIPGIQKSVPNPVRTLAMITITAV